MKNPKQTVATPKDQLPDYTKYQLPSSPQTGNGLATALNSLPVLQSHHNAMAAAAIKGGITTSDFLAAHSMRPPPPPPHPPPPDRLDYLSTLAGRLPPAIPQRYFAPHNTLMQAPAGVTSSIVSDQSRIYQPLAMMNYPPGVSPASLLQPQTLAGGNPNPPQGAYDVGEVAQQLIACRNNSSSQNPMGHWDSNIDSAILEYIRDSRRQNVPSPNVNSVGLRQDVMSAMARRDFYPQGPPPY